ncbi:MAG: HAMP domain-containing histidine kinase [Tissierellia bacterium]|nr:HAMP domain-containing histidine kinase [Tissierellia bacterium]
MNLFRKIILSFILTILVSITIISITSNIMINNRFKNYLEEEQQIKFDKIYEEINNYYIDENLSLNQMNLMHYSMAEDIDLTIKDTEENIIYTTKNSPKNGMGRMHMGRNSMHANKYGLGNYVEKLYPLVYDSNAVGSLTIGYIDNSYITDGAVIFLDTMTQSLSISGLFAIAIGIIISLVLSNSLTKPLMVITETANKIRHGDLKAKSNVCTNTKEIIELSNTINYLSNTLSDQDKIRKQYASDISHELRTPLTTLKSHLEAMLDKVLEPSDEHLEILMTEINRLSKLIDDLKDSFVKEEYSMDLNLIEVDITEELMSIIKTYEPLYEEKGFSIEFNFKEDILILIDIDRFKQIMNNLLSNSLRYLNKDGKVIVDLLRNDDSILLSVSDNGIGIKANDLPYVFNRFFRVDTSRNKSTGGTGLGLPIVKSIVEAHNGSITINSEYGKGTNITIKLPITKKNHL